MYLFIKQAEDSIILPENGNIRVAISLLEQTLKYVMN
jgi:hypothetical protein